MSSTDQPRKLLLLGIDGADWNLISPLIDKGELPAFQHLVEKGTMANLATLSPTLSPILWTSIATGKRAGLHGIHGFTEVDPESDRVRPVSSLSRQCKAAWNILQQNGQRVHLSNWFASHPAEPLNGICLTDFFPNTGDLKATEPPPVSDHSVHPWSEAERFGDCRVLFDDIDTEIGSLFIKDIDEVQEKKDQRVTQLGMELARAYTLQTAALEVLDQEDWNFLGVYFRTIDILCHIFMPFHPPQMEGVPDELFHHYGDTVNSAYRFIDLLLTHLITRAGEDATIMLISDHGFLSDDLRPQPDLKNSFADPEGWHRDQGILLAAGPGIKKDHLIHGAGLLDITPTILSLFDLPVGKDMQGRPLVAMFEDERQPEYIDTWEEVAGDTGQHPSGAAMGDADAKELLDRFVELGYIEALGDNAKQNAAQTRMSNAWNLARDYLDYGAWADALPLLEQLHHDAPQNQAYTGRLAFAQWRLGLHDEAERTLGDALRLAQEGPVLSLLRGHLALERDDVEEALAHYQAAAEHARGIGMRDIHLAIGRAWLRLENLENAEAAFREALELEPENAAAFQGLARTLFAAERHEEAAHAALDAISLEHNRPDAHAVLGHALVALDRHADAAKAYESCLVYDPNRLPVLRRLAALCRDHLNDAHAALTWQTRAARVQQESETRADPRERLREEIEQRRLAREREAVWDKSDSPEELEKQQAELRERIAALTEPPAAAGERLEPGQEFILVSGLPRSGTSLMMQMLRAGGLDPMTDDKRAADEHNPEGYFEWDEIRRLPENPLLIEQALGKVTKVVSPLLPHLPPQHRYKVILMERPPSQVEASQRKMLGGPAGAAANSEPDPAAIRSALDQLRKRTADLLEKADRFEVLSVTYPELVADPAAIVSRIAAFLENGASGTATPLDQAAMAASVRPDLHREKSA